MKLFLNQTKNFLKLNKSLKNINKIKFNFCTKIEQNQTQTQNKEEVKDEKYYEQEWTKLYIEKRNADKAVLEKELTDLEKREVELLTDLAMGLNEIESKYYMLLLQDVSKDIYNVDPMEDDDYYPSQLNTSSNLWPKDNGKWFKTPSFESAIAAFSGGKVGKYSL